jgi:hypothetical protein
VAVVAGRWSSWRFSRRRAVIPDGGVDINDLGVRDGWSGSGNGRKGSDNGSTHLDIWYSGCEERMCCWYS